MVRSGIFLRITPRARSASTRGSRSPPISASIMSRAESVVMLEATESILMPPSFEDLGQPLQLPGPRLDQLLAVAGQLPGRRDLRGWDEAAPQQTALQQLPQPRTVDDIGLAARDVLHMPGVDQHDLQGITLAQGVEDRLPVHPGRLHRHVRDALLDQPPNHLLQHGVEGLELSDLLTSLPRALPRHPNSDRDLPLAHIDPRDPCVHDLHNGLLPAATDQPGHVTRGSRIKIKILRFALTGSNPGYPTGAGSSVNLRAGLAGTKNKRRQRATPPVSPTQGVSSAP